MSQENTGKLNRLQRELPEGLLVTASWLSEQGYSAQLCNKYVAGRWLERLAQGVYRRPGGKLTWEQVVISLQTLLGFPVFIGGRTALTLHGFAHYITREETNIQLYGPRRTPPWLDRLPMTARFHYHNSRALFRSEPVAYGLTGQMVDLRNTNIPNREATRDGFTIIPWGQWDWPLTLSAPERAILEVLDGLPAHESFELADKFMESLTTLRPRRLQKLLVDCKSIKVKRLFFFFADRHRHAWLKHLDKQAIDLGTGKRMLVRGGKLDPTYMITVPEEFHGGR